MPTMGYNMAYVLDLNQAQRGTVRGVGRVTSTRQRNAKYFW